MSIFEIRSGALTALVEADDELDAVSIATDGGVLADGDTGSVAEYDGRPVGADGTDPEEPDDDVSEPLHDPRGPNPT